MDGPRRTCDSSATWGTARSALFRWSGSRTTQSWLQRTGQPVVRAEVVVDPDDRLLLGLVSRALPDVVVDHGIGRRVQDAGRRHRRVDIPERVHDRRIGRRELSVRRRHREDVDFPDLAAHGVAEPALLRAGMEHACGCARSCSAAGAPRSWRRRTPSLVRRTGPG